MATQSELEPRIVSPGRCSARKSLANRNQLLRIASENQPAHKFSIELFESFELEQFERNGEEKLRSIDEIAPPESPWFLNQSKEPFSSAFSHPAGRLASPSRMDIKRCSHTEQNRSPQTAAVPMHPLLLFGRAETHPNDVRRGAVDRGHQFFPLLGRTGSKRRGACARNHEPRKPALEGGREAIRDARHTANQEMTEATRGCLPAQFEHELGPVDPARERPSAKTAEPNQRHAIGHHQVGSVEHGLEGRIMLRLHDPVHAGHRDIATSIAALDPFADGSTYFRKLKRLHMHTQDVEGSPRYSAAVHTFTRQPRPPLRAIV